MQYQIYTIHKYGNIIILCTFKLFKHYILYYFNSKLFGIIKLRVKCYYCLLPILIVMYVIPVCIQESQRKDLQVFRECCCSKDQV